MDKPSERKKDSKEWGDTDVGSIRRFSSGNVRAELDGLWDHAPKEVVGLGLDRLLTNDYCKSGDKDSPTELAEEILSSGPPFSNVSKPNRVL